jgi:hypothetical protein
VSSRCDPAHAAQQGQDRERHDGSGACEECDTRRGSPTPPAQPPNRNHRPHIAGMDTCSRACLFAAVSVYGEVRFAVSRGHLHQLDRQEDGDLQLDKRSMTRGQVSRGGGLCSANTMLSHLDSWAVPPSLVAPHVPVRGSELVRQPLPSAEINFPWVRCTQALPPTS